MAKRFFIAAALILALCFGFASTTQINLTVQIQGLLPIANGGTGASTLAAANIGVINVTNTWSAVQTFNNNDISLLGSSTGYITFSSANSGATNYTVTFPANTGTLDELNLAQTFTAVKTFTNSDLCLLGSSTGCTTFTSANSSATNYTATFPAVTNNVLEGDIGSSGGTPRIQQEAFDSGSGAYPLADTTSQLLGGLYVTKAITVRAAWVETEKAASSCTTEPAYELYYNTSLSSTSATLISSSNCTATGTTNGSTVSCSITATSVPAADYVFWEVKTAASSCAPWLKLVFEYTMN